MILFGEKREWTEKIAPPTPKNVDIFLRAFEQRQDFEDFELQLYDADGALIWHAIRAGNIERSKKHSLHVIGTIRNIQAQKNAEARRKEKEQELFIQSRYDPITRLLNRSAMQQAIENQISSGKSYLFAIIDIDNFKSVNDTYGHVFGDEVLKYVADILRGACRAEDTTGRLGGDEFIVLFSSEFSKESAMCRLTLILKKSGSNASIFPFRPRYP